MSQTILVKLGGQIRDLRKGKGLSQEDLAEVTRLHRTYIGGVERGERNIGIINLQKISVALGTTLADLFKDVE